MPITTVQSETYETGDVTSLTVDLPAPPLEGNLVRFAATSAATLDEETLINLGWSLPVDPPPVNITGGYLWQIIVGPNYEAPVLIPSVTASIGAYIWESTSNDDDPLDVYASDTTAPSFTAEVSTGSTSPAFLTTTYADQEVIAVFFRNGTGFVASAFTGGFEHLITLQTTGTFPVGMIIATLALTELVDELECVATISGGNLSPAGLLASYKAAPAGLVSRSLREQYEEAPNAYTVEIANTGDGTLSWTAEADVDWVQLTPESGTAPSTLTVKLLPEGLAPGDYDGEITITAAGATNTPQTIPVSVTVSPETSLISGISWQAFRVFGDRATVAARTPRTAEFLTAGPTSAAFERPTVAAAFEQPAGSIIR